MNFLSNSNSSILGIGIDTIEIGRFTAWFNYPSHKLRRVFSQEEIDYCHLIPSKSAERFAVRFAAKEAFYKALSQSLITTESISLFSIIRHVRITLENQKPRLIIDWTHIPILKEQNPILSHISLTHSRTIATGLVILEHIR